MKPLQTADTSNTGQWVFIFSLLLTMHAVEGTSRSGLDVATIMQSIS